MTNIVLHIDRLVLRGVPRGDAAAIAASLQAELRAALPAMLDASGALAQLKAQARPDLALRAQACVGAGGGLAGIGRAVARCIVNPAPAAPHAKEGAP